MVIFLKFSFQPWIYHYRSIGEAGVRKWLAMSVGRQQMTDFYDTNCLKTRITKHITSVKSFLSY